MRVLLSRSQPILVMALPIAAFLLTLVTWGRSLPGVVTGVAALILFGAVLSAVHHAEVVAHRVGEPFGSLVLAVAVTVIEVALIVTLMLSGGAEKAGLARDTVFAALMITMNGMVGVSLLVATFRKKIAVFNSDGSTAALATIAALAVLSLVLPAFTTSTAGPTFSGPQLVFAAVASLVLYGVYLFVQTVRHRDYFLTPDEDHESSNHVSPTSTPAPQLSEAELPTVAQTDLQLSSDASDDELEHAPPPSNRTALVSFILLVVALIGVVGLSKGVSPSVEGLVKNAGLPLTVVAVSIAMMVLLPESLAAVRAARRGRVQVSFNLAYGSALASIGLTIPVIAVFSIWLPDALQLGLNPAEIVLLALTFLLAVLTVRAGRASIVQAAVHIVVFVAFLVLAFSP